MPAPNDAAPDSGDRNATRYGPTPPADPAATHYTDPPTDSDPAATRYSDTPADPHATVYPQIPQPTTPLLPAIEGYEILGELGKGGMGVVYKARQFTPERMVALKLIRAGQLADEEDVRLFQKEANEAARLDHPNIVPVHEVGEHNGLHYFTMKLIEGGSLNQRLDRYRNDPKAAARLVATAARAVHYAHQRQLLHRDLKPGNILLDAAGQPHVADFGLAKRLDGESVASQSGAVVGTPEYMAPEQARGEKHLTTAADVYALGGVLYTLLTGRPPFRDPGGAGLVLVKVLTEEPTSLSKVRAGVPRDLETICLKCLQKEPTRRYGSAEAVAEDLERWLKGEPVRGRPVGRMERVRLWCRRKPAVAAFLALFVLTLIAGASISTWLGILANDRAGRAEQNASAAKAALKKVEEEQGRTAGALARAQEAVAVGLLRPMGHDPHQVDPVELNALWELAALRSDQDQIRGLFVDRALLTEATAKQLGRRCAIAIHAAVGLVPERRKEALKTLLSLLHSAEPNSRIQRACAVGAAELGPLAPADADEVMLVVLRQIPKNHSFTAVRSLMEAAKAVAPQMDSAGATDAAMEIQHAFAETTAAYKQVVASGNVDDTADFDAAYRRAALGFAFAAVAPAMQQNAASERADMFFEEALGYLNESSRVRPRLISGMRAYSAWLDAKEAEDAGKRIVDTDEDTITFFKYEDYVSQLLVVMTNMRKNLAKQTALDAATKLVSMLGDSHDPYSLSDLAAAVDRLAPFMDEDAAHGCADSVAKKILESMAAQKAEDRPRLVKAWKKLAPRMSSATSADAAKQLRDDITRTKDIFLISDLAEEFAAVSPQEDVAVVPARKLLERLKTQQDSADLSITAKALAAMLPFVGEEEASKSAGAAARRLLDLMVAAASSDNYDDYEYGALREGLAAVASRLDSAEASVDAAWLIEYTRNHPSLPTHDLALALSILASHDSDAAHMAAVAKAFLDATKENNSPSRLQDLGEGLAIVAPRLDEATRRVVADKLAQSICDAMDKRSGAASHEALCRGLGAIIPHMTHDAARADLGAESRRIVEGIKQAAEDGLHQGFNPDEVIQRDLFRAFGVVVRQMDTPAAASDIIDVDVLTSSWQDSGDYDIWRSVSEDELADPFRKLLARFSTQELVNILKHPGCVGWPRAAVLEQLGRQLNHKFDTVWDLVDWLKANRPDLDLTSPPTRP